MLFRSPARQPPFLPVAMHDALADGIKAGGWTVECNRDLAAVQKTLQCAHAASLLYYYCHGKSDAPLAADPLSKLAFGTTQIDPAWIQDEPRFTQTPVVVLNSCSSGEANPLSFISFLERFRSKGAAGVVSTWFAIPMLFASAFGRELVTQYAARVPIGDALYDLRRRLLDQDHPLGLFYALQCPMDLQAPAVRRDPA